jgi:hypothetical protein
MRRLFSALIGAVAFLVVDLTLNLLAAAIQARSFADQFTDRSIWILIVILVGGFVVGFWLSGMVTLPAQAVAAPLPAQPSSARGVAISRFRAILSYGKLRGKGIKLSDILLVGAVLDIDTRDE